MAKVMDRTEDFKDAVRAAAITAGYSESEIAATMSSFIMHKVQQRSSFTKAALKTLESIVELKNFIIKHRKDYIDLHRTTEQEKDNIQFEVSSFIKACEKQIGILQNMIYDGEKNGTARTWIHKRDDSSTVDAVAHKHGMVLILSERLLSVTKQFDQLRSVRDQNAINRLVPRRKPHRAPVSRSLQDSLSDHAEPIQQEHTSAPTRVQEQLLDDETRALQIELSNLLDTVQLTETKMVEVSALNHLLSTHVLQQARQIEELYEQAVAATENVEKGNKELSQAIKRNSCSRTLLVFFMFVPTFSLLFLHWYS